MASLPTGTVTFLFTDIEGSTRLWERDPDAMRQATRRHDELVEECVRAHQGVLVRPRGEGDSRFAVFLFASDAVQAALSLQQALWSEPWPTPTPLRVRMGLHTGEADLREGDYYGIAVNRCARIRAAGHGGQVLLSQATSALVASSLPPGAGLRDLGEHSLEGLQQPEHLYQLLHPKLPSDFAPLRTAGSVPNNLPQQVTSFVGREKETSEAKRLLQSTRLLTLTGSGGVGKTRLSLQVASEQLHRYPDGAWLVELAPLADEEMVPQAVTCALGATEAREPGGGRGREAALEALLDYLQPKKLLLVLDNCEHLLKSCALLAQAVLRSCPQVRVLASSREALRIPGETLYRLPSLSTPDPEQVRTAEDLLRCDAARLLVDRVAAANPRFAATNENAQALARICRRLDGIPLALELAAACVASMPVEQVADRLDDRFALLTSGSRAALPRQQTLRALVDWSYDLLTEPERALLRRLSVFSGGWTLEAAERVCAGPGVPEREVLPLLTRLVEKSLVVYEPEAASDARYHLQETMRLYAQERLQESGEAEETRGRHRAYYVSLVMEGGPKLLTTDQSGWYERLSRENANLTSALGWCLMGLSGVEAGVRVATELSRSWLLDEKAPAKTLLRKGLGLARGLGDRARSAAPLQALGGLASRTESAEPTRTLVEEAASLDSESARRGEPALCVLAVTACAQGRPAEARARLQEALTALARRGDPAGIAFALDALAVAAAALGEMERAACLFGAAQSLRESRSLPALSEEQVRAARAAARSALGERGFEAARLRGRCLSQERAVIYALASG